MTVPNTGGVLRTKIEDMQVGDYISCSYATSNLKKTSGLLASLGSSTNDDSIVTGISSGGIKFYFIKVDKGLLIADRVCRNSVSWDTLNADQLVQGDIWENCFGSGTEALVDVSGIIRSLGGGNSYASATGTSATADAGLGAWPQDNEWEKYIVGLFGGADDVWHWKNIVTLCQDTVTTGVGAATSRFSRGYNTVKDTHVNASSFSFTSHGFRPVFEFIE